MLSETIASRASREAPDPGVVNRWPAALIWKSGEPAVRPIGIGDLKEAFAKGVDDFWAMPTHIALLVIIYPVAGLILARLMISHDMMHLLYPLLTGLILVGAAAAVGLYEMSRRRELGLDAGPEHALDVLKSPSIGAIGRLALVLAGMFMLWLWLADAMYVSLMGAALPTSLGDFVSKLFTTPGGRQLIVTGNLAGLMFAIVALMVSVVSFPMLVDRPVSVGTAVRASVRAVLESPGTMAIWGVFVTLALAVGALPLLLGLAVIVPVLGHATWHLYRKVVSRTETIP